MAKNISLLGANYPDVPAVQLPQTGGGTATFYDMDAIQVETVSTTVGESVAANSLKECTVDISTLKQQYSRVYFLSFAGANGANYASFGFMFAYTVSANTYTVGMRNYSSSAQNLASFDSKFLCIK